MKKGLFLITTAMLLASCSFFVDQAKDTVKKVSEISEEAANKAATKAGEIVGGSARSFGDGVGEGIDKSGSMALQLSEELASAGVFSENCSNKGAQQTTSRGRKDKTRGKR